MIINCSAVQSPFLYFRSLPKLTQWSHHTLTTSLPALAPAALPSQSSPTPQVCGPLPPTVFCLPILKSSVLALQCAFPFRWLSLDFAAVHPLSLEFGLIKLSRRFVTVTRFFTTRWFCCLALVVLFVWENRQVGIWDYRFRIWGFLIQGSTFAKTVLTLVAV